MNQKYFWCAILEDESIFPEFETNGKENLYNDIPREKVIYFGLTSAQENYFFDLKTGEYHFKNKDIDLKQDIRIPFGHSPRPIPITGILSNNKKYEFYQYKEGYTEFNIRSLENSGNIIGKHIIGWKTVKPFMGQHHLIDVKLTIDPNQNQVKPKLEVVIQRVNGGIVGKYSITT